MSEVTEMDNITNKMMEHVCDELCKHSDVVKNPEELEDICAECEMVRYICDILNQYNRVNDFDKTQSAKLLAELTQEREKHNWIPVEERLPKEHEETSDLFDSETLAVIDSETHKVSDLVNVTVIDHDDDKAFVADDCTVDGKWSNFGGDHGRFEVIAWQPLPEPYEPEKEG